MRESGKGELAACILLTYLVVPVPAAAQSSAVFTYAAFGTRGVRLSPDVTVVDGDLGSNQTVALRRGVWIQSAASVAAHRVRVGKGADIAGEIITNDLGGAPVSGNVTFGLTLPVLTIPPAPNVAAGGGSVSVEEGETLLLPSGVYEKVRADPGSTLIFDGSEYDIDQLRVRSRTGLPTAVLCAESEPCTVRVRTRLSLAASSIGSSGSDLAFHFAGTRSVTVGRSGALVRAVVQAPLATVRLRSSRKAVSSFTGRYAGFRVRVGSGALVARGPLAPGTCGNGLAEPPSEDCDGADDSACPGECLAGCECTPTPETPATLHSVGPSVLHNATDFGVQLFGEDFQPGAVLELSDADTGEVLATLPTTWVSFNEMTALVPAGLPVPTGIERELVARIINPGAAASDPPDIGRCATDMPDSPIACTADHQCPPGAGSCIQGIQRLTLFNDLVFLNPNSAALVPPPHGLCDDGSRCQSAVDCAGIGTGACSPKLYVTPQQQDELWVYNTGTSQFVDQDSGNAGIRGIPTGDNPFHVEILDLGLGLSRAWVVNRFDDSVSIIDTATDAEITRVTGASLGIPGRLRMETEIEFNRAGTRAYLSNENLDELQVLDIDGAQLDAPVLVGSIEVGVNPRGMVTNASDTRLYVANIQSADISVVDIEAGSATENEVVATIAARATDDIVGGRADGWEAFVISGRAPRGIIYSDAHDALFVTSIGPQTGPREGVVLTGGAIINPTITVIDAATSSIVAHVALNGLDPDRASCTDPELMALDDARNRLYVTCQGSGTVDVLDTAALVAGAPAELAMIGLPLPADVAVPTLSIPSEVGGFGNKVCAAFTSSSGVACTFDSDCAGCPTLVEGLPVPCCSLNNPVGLHNGPRGIALSADGDTLHVVNQFTTSISTLDVSPGDPTLIGVIGTTSYPGAFGNDIDQQDRRLGQIDFFTDVRRTNVSCATCHIDDHQDGVFFEADVRGPRLRRVLSVRATRDFPPLLQDQLVPDLAAFTDIVVQAERGGNIPCTTCVEIGGSFFCLGGEGTCEQTSVLENQQNALYAKAITFFPNPNLNDDGSLSTAVPLPGGVTGNAILGASLFDQLDCKTCHPEPLFTIDQFRSFETASLGQPVRMREVGTPVAIPLRLACEDLERPSGSDGSSGFSVPTLRGIWDTFPLLLSGSAGLTAAGPEPAFSPGCMPGSGGCCAELESPLNPSGIPVPEQHLQLTTKDALRASLTAPLAAAGTGHGAVLGLSSSELNALLAYLRSL